MTRCNRSVEQSAQYGNHYEHEAKMIELGKMQKLFLATVA